MERSRRWSGGQGERWEKLALGISHYEKFSRGFPSARRFESVGATSEIINLFSNSRPKYDP